MAKPSTINSLQSSTDLSILPTSTTPSIQPTNLEYTKTSTTMSLDQTTTPLPTPTDAHTRLLNASCLDFLLIELVPMAERLVNEPREGDRKPADGDGNEQHGTMTTTTQPDDEEARRESTFFRLEGLGYRVGQGLAER